AGLVQRPLDVQSGHSSAGHAGLDRGQVQRSSDRVFGGVRGQAAHFLLSFDAVHRSTDQFGPRRHGSVTPVNSANVLTTRLRSKGILNWFPGIARAPASSASTAAVKA